MVSNNPYRLTGLGGVGSRARLDTGELGVVTVEIHGAKEMSELVAAQAAGRIQRFRGYEEWTTPSFTVAFRQPGRGRGRRRGPPARSPPRVPLPARRPADPGAHRVVGQLTGGHEGPLAGLDGAGPGRSRRRAWPPGRDRRADPGRRTPDGPAVRCRGDGGRRGRRSPSPHRWWRRRGADEHVARVVHPGVDPGVGDRGGQPRSGTVRAGTTAGHGAGERERRGRVARRERGGGGHRSPSVRRDPGPFPVRTVPTSRRASSAG